MLLRGRGIFCEIVGFLIFMVCFIMGIILGFDRGNDILLVVFVWDMGLIIEVDVVCVICMFFLVIVDGCMNVCGWNV